MQQVIAIVATRSVPCFAYYRYALPTIKFQRKRCRRKINENVQLDIVILNWQKFTFKDSKAKFSIAVINFNKFKQSVGRLVWGLLCCEVKERV